MGNIKLIVKDIHIEYNEETEDKLTNYDIYSLNKDGGPIFNLSPEPKKYIISTEEAKNQNKKCYICHLYKCNIEDPIICFCDCNSLFHFKCFKKSIEKNVLIKSNKTKTINNYYIRELYCKYCQLNYPLSFIIKEKEQFFKFINIDINKEDNYIVLESIENKIYYENIKLLFVIKLDEKEISIGRKEEMI